MLSIDNGERKSKRQSVFEEVTARIMEELENGRVPWRQPWRPGGRHRNLRTKRPYSGVNAILTSMTALARGFERPYWLTLREANELGGRVKQSEKATPIVFFKPQWGEKQDAGGRPVTDERGNVVLEKRPPILVKYHVFNVEQCRDVPLPAEEPTREFVPHGGADAIVTAWSAGPSVAHGGDKAYYAPALDAVFMPHRSQFEAEDAYYHTLFHELTHATGHESRLARFPSDRKLPPFGSPDYAHEELVAEIGASFLLARAGMQPRYPDAAAYIRGWLRALANDSRLVVYAATQAEKAALLVAGPEERGEAAPAGDAAANAWEAA